MTKTVAFKVWAFLAFLIVLAFISQPFLRLQARAHARQDFAAICETDKAANFPAQFCPNVRKSLKDEPNDYVYASKETKFPIMVAVAVLLSAVASGLAFLPFWLSSYLLSAVRSSGRRRVSDVAASVAEAPPSVDQIAPLASIPVEPDASIATPPRKSWWRRLPKAIRTWLFWSLVWSPSAVLLSVVFNFFESRDAWEYGDYFGAEGMQVWTLALIPWIGGLIWLVYEKRVK